jgi:hypothetical protein
MPAVRRLRTFERFAPEARQLREHVDARFADPRRADEGRFVWDYWHVPGQYTALRTPAWRYFPEALYASFHERLVRFGREVLGCHDVSPPWMSCYVDGCEQLLHGDLPHGPLAFVFSLTRWRTRSFRGGETLLLRDETLDFWSRFESVRRVEEGEVLEAVEPLFNRLTVFDPRVPHGVRRVEGTRDPREGRLVIHGWFVQPRPFVEGPLRTAELRRALDHVANALPAIVGGAPVAGVYTVRFRVRASGEIEMPTLLVDTLRIAGADETELRRVRRGLASTIRGLSFKKQRAASTITLPVVIDR